jgi:hypothetical protein
MFKRKIQIPDPVSKFPTFHQKKRSNSRLLQIPNKQIPQVCPGGRGCQGFDLIRALHKEKHINSTRKRVQGATQHIFHRKPAQFFENSTKLCEIYISRSVKNRHFETELNMSLEHSIIAVRNCARAYKGMG